MIPKPRHLDPEYAGAFQAQSVYSVYRYRPPYPEDTIRTLVSLIRDTPRRVLDIGCGTGDLARRIAPLVDRVDAVDVSQGMIDEGKRLPNGDHPALKWVCGRVEDVDLDPPYALITAGESLHWMAWDIVLPRFAQILAPKGCLAIVDREWLEEPVLERLRPIFRCYSVNREYQPIDLLTELKVRGLFGKLGEELSDPEPWRPTVDEFMACMFSQSGFRRDRVGKEVGAFDRAIRAALAELVAEGQIAERDGWLDLQVKASVVWGAPLAPE